MTSFHDLEIMARTIWGEARGESQTGRTAVGNVIMNRVHHPSRWPKSPAEVCQQPWQFSCWNEGDPNRTKLLEVDLDDTDLRQCIRAALTALTGVDQTNGSNHYFANYIEKPSWAEDMEHTCTIGVHQFYKG